MIRVTIYSLTTPLTPMLYRDFTVPVLAELWATWARATLPCVVEVIPSSTADDSAVDADITDLVA